MAIRDYSKELRKLKEDLQKEIENDTITELEWADADYDLKRTVSIIQNKDTALWIYEAILSWLGEDCGSIDWHDIGTALYEYHNDEDFELNKVEAVVSEIRSKMFKGNIGFWLFELDNWWDWQGKALDREED
jgi:hypothetical protein